MATELTRPSPACQVPPTPEPLPVPISSRVTLRVVNVPNFQEATLRRLITPQVEIDQATATVTLVSQGLTLREELRTAGDTAILIEVSARYRRGEGAIKQLYRYLVFQENGTTYCQRLPMGSWAPSDPDECLEWLGRGGLQQGDFVLLPRKRLPAEAVILEPPGALTLWQRAMTQFKALFADPLAEQEIMTSEWGQRIGRHNPVGCTVLRHQDRLFVVAPHDTVVEHPEHAPLPIPAGTYEVVEDRASRYWRHAID